MYKTGLPASLTSSIPKRYWFVATPFFKRRKDPNTKQFINPRDSYARNAKRSGSILFRQPISHPLNYKGVLYSWFMLVWIIPGFMASLFKTGFSIYMWLIGLAAILLFKYLVTYKTIKADSTIMMDTDLKNRN